MHAIDTPGSVAGKFLTADPQAGRRGTLVGADWLNDLQANVLAVLAEAGVVPTKGRAADLLDAIKDVAGGVGGDGEGGVPTTRRIETTGLLTGGRDLTNDVELSVPRASPAEIEAGVEDGKAITPAGLRAAGDAGLLGNGYARLPGGLIIQWGSIRGSYSEGNVRIDFPIPFPAACFSVAPVAVNTTGGSTRDIWTQIVGRDTQGFTTKFQLGGGGTTNSIDGLDYLAVGA